MRTAATVTCMLMAPLSSYEVQSGPTLSLVEQLLTLRGFGSDSILDRFGKVTSVATNAAGDIFVLDQDLGRVGVFGPDGTYRFSLGKPGRGPGHIAVPQEILLTPDGHLHILDVASEQITEYGFLQAGVRAHFLRSIPLPDGGSSFCAMQGHLFVLGLSNEQLVREIDANGKLVRSFGVPYGQANRLIQTSLSAGMVVCLPEHDLILVVPSLVPEIRAYSPTGELVWVSQLERYSPVSYTLIDPGSVRFSLPPSGQYHMTLAAFRVMDSLVAIQIGTMAKRGKGPVGLIALQTRFLSTRDGFERGQQSGLPLVRHLSGSKLYALGNDNSTTQVKVFKYKILQGSR